MSTAAARRSYAGPALFSFGFRPFFLLGAAWAALSVPLWALSAAGLGLPLTRDWHVHEMLFGFLAAVVAGFLTTAVPNWTGRMPVVGRPLAAMVALWLAGRIAMALQAWLGGWAAAVDSLFLLVFAGVIWREVLTGRNWRNLPVCGLVSVFAAGNVAFHLAAGNGLGERLALGAATVLIALIGGRIVPSFTRNWMRARGLAPEPAAGGGVDQASLSLSAAAALAWGVAPAHPATGLLLALAGAANAMRLARWQGLRTLAEPLVWSLHLGYAWLALGQGLLGLTVLWPAAPRTLGVHALTAGAIGAMTLAVMTRATRGHTGRPLAADRATTALYLLAAAAAAVRLVAPLAAGAMPTLLVASSLLWMVAFGGFAAVYGRMLATPRPSPPQRP